MQFTQKYTIIQLLEDLPEGTEFSSSSWPLHTTLVDVFAIEWSVTDMAKQLEGLLSSVKPFSTVARDNTLFGPNQETQVTLLEKTPELIALHNTLADLLELGGLKVNNPEFFRKGFLPHATVQKHAQLRRGDKVSFTALSIIDMFPDGDPYKRKILKTIPIGKPRPDPEI